MSLLFALAVIAAVLIRRHLRSAPPAPALAARAVRPRVPAALPPLSSPGACTPARIPAFGDAGYGIDELFGRAA